MIVDRAGKLFHSILHKNANTPYPDADIVIEYGSSLSCYFEEEQGWDMAERIEYVRQSILERFHILIPPISFYENKKMFDTQYTFKIKGIMVATELLLPDHYMAIPTLETEDDIEGIESCDPVSYLETVWITKQNRELVEEMGYLVVDCPMIIVAHFSAIMEEYLSGISGKIIEEETGMPTLSKGVFWITDLEELENNKMFYPIPVDPMGNIDGSFDRRKLNSKKGDNYNHEKLWKNINTKETRQKEFDYYPRGRVEISGGKAIIYASPHICTEEIAGVIREKFHLTEENGIKEIVIIPDYSKHYQCYLDRE